MAECKICDKEIDPTKADVCFKCMFIMAGINDMNLKQLTYFFERIHLLIQEKGK